VSELACELPDEIIKGHPALDGDVMEGQVTGKFHTAHRTFRASKERASPRSRPGLRSPSATR
jgi:hypothetical protein